ncbi:putative dehydrogenase [Novosphingobium sp. PY1]|nr:putative dehydrogenase [Novosphingobium sp. PY1]GFM31277.1 putative dehydrogenase [Novosphingobium sp. PY1]
MQQVIPLSQGFARIGTFEVVGRIEEVLPSGLALAAREGPQAVEPPSDGADEAPLALAVGGNGTEDRRTGLVGAMGAPKPLDGARRLPARFEQDFGVLRSISNQIFAINTAA